MIICNIEELPGLGEPCIVPDTVTEELYEMEPVYMQEDPALAKMMGRERCVHVYFAALDEEENMHMAPNKNKYTTIRTYA